MNFIKKYIETKEKEVKEKKEVIDPRVFRMSPTYKKRRVSLKKHLDNWEGPVLIPIFMRYTPEGNMMDMDLKPHAVAKSLEQSGAAAWAVATDDDNFGAVVEDMRSIRKHTKLPIIRFDIIMDEYQIMESKAMGADAIMLNAAVSTEKEIERLTEKAKEEKLSVILQIYHADDLVKLTDDIKTVCLNLKNPDSREQEKGNADAVIQKIPKGVSAWVTGGISSPEEVKDLQQKGFQGFLIGEAWMEDAVPAFVFENWVGKLNK